MSYQFPEPVTAPLVLLVAVAHVRQEPAMSNDKVLTKNIAKQFLEDEDSAVDLDEFTAIEDAAAKSLSNHEGRLDLSGLTSLSDAAAESLSKHKGYLVLKGLTSLSDAAAKSLSKHDGYIDRTSTITGSPNFPMPPS